MRILVVIINHSSLWTRAGAGKIKAAQLISLQCDLLPLGESKRNQERPRPRSSVIKLYPHPPPLPLLLKHSKVYSCATVGRTGVNEWISIALCPSIVEPYPDSSHWEFSGNFTNKRSDISCTPPGRLLRVSLPRTCTLLVSLDTYHTLHAGDTDGVPPSPPPPFLHGT